MPSLFLRKESQQIMVHCLLQRPGRGSPSRKPIPYQQGLGRSVSIYHKRKSRQVFQRRIQRGILSGRHRQIQDHLHSQSSVRRHCKRLLLRPLPSQGNPSYQILVCFNTPRISVRIILSGHILVLVKKHTSRNSENLSFQVPEQRPQHLKNGLFRFLVQTAGSKRANTDVKSTSSHKSIHEQTFLLSAWRQTPMFGSASLSMP